MANILQTLSSAIGVLDKTSAPLRKVAERMGYVTARVERATGPVERFRDRLHDVRESLVRLGKAAGLDRVASSAKRAGKQVGGLVKRISGFDTRSFSDLKTHMIDAASRAENLRQSLSQLMGSSAGGAKAFQFIEDFALKTPLQLEEVNKAFRNAVTLGIDPYSGALQAAGNAAAAVDGKSMEDVMNAMNAAGEGDNSGLADYGVQARQQGEMMVYEYEANGKTMVAQARANNKEMIEATVSGIMNQKFKGAMAERSGTWSGMLSTMTEQFDKFSRKVMESGSMEFLTDKLKGALDVMEMMQQSGLASLVSTAVAIGQLTLAFIPATAAVIDLGIALMTTPVGWILGAIALIAGAVYLIYRNWDSIALWFTAKLDAVLDAFDGGFFGGLWALFREFSPAGLILELVNGLVKALFGVDLLDMITEPLLDPFAQALGKVAEFLASINLFETGAQIINSLWDGLKASWSQVSEWLSGVGDKISSWLPAWLGGDGDDDASGGSRGTGAGQVMRNAASQGTLGPGQQTVRTEVHIKADNLPPGMIVTTPASAADRTNVDLGPSYAGGM